MKSLIKKIAVFVFALVVMVSTASTVLAQSSGNPPGQGGWGGQPPGQGGPP